MGDDMTAYGTKRANGDHLTGALNFQGGGVCLYRLDVYSQLQQRQTHYACSGDLHKFPPIVIHACLLSKVHSPYVVVPP
jgi:hypothetical protein